MISNPDASTNRSRNGAADLEVQALGEHEAGGGLVGPPRVGRASRHHRPAFGGRAEPFVVGDDRQEVDRPHAATGARLPGEEQAHAGAGRRRSPAAARRCRRGRRRHRAFPPAGRTGCSRPRARRRRSSRRTNSGYARGGAGGAGEQPQHDPAAEAGDEGDAEPGDPTPAQLGSQASEHRRHSCSFPARFRRWYRLRRRPFLGGRRPAKLTAHHCDAGRGTIWTARAL